MLILHARQNPSDERSLRAALATGLFDLDARASTRCPRTSGPGRARCRSFMDTVQDLAPPRVLAMLRALLHGRNLAASFWRAPRGAAADQLPSISASCCNRRAASWTGNTPCCAGWGGGEPEGQDGEQILRLESGASWCRSSPSTNVQGAGVPAGVPARSSAATEAPTPPVHEAGEAGNRTVLDLTGPRSPWPGPTRSARRRSAPALRGPDRGSTPPGWAGAGALPGRASRRRPTATAPPSGYLPAKGKRGRRDLAPASPIGPGPCRGGRR